jgi:hypothetical protein
MFAYFWKKSRRHSLSHSIHFWAITQDQEQDQMFFHLVSWDSKEDKITKYKLSASPSFPLKRAASVSKNAHRSGFRQG